MILGEWQLTTELRVRPQITTTQSVMSVQNCKGFVNYFGGSGPVHLYRRLLSRMHHILGVSRRDVEYKKPTDTLQTILSTICSGNRNICKGLRLYRPTDSFVDTRRGQL